ncbi:nitroreductase family protein [Candidatus Woesearchaeota archaeon]|nr:nitroreductase family protein [Candidatus Woesearchaeota archaeon]
MKNTRKTEHNINPIFLNRWSPRAISKDVTKEEIMTLFEAAKWSPSASNIQPWRFIYAMNGTLAWSEFFNLLAEFNQMWSKNAAALVIVASKKTNDEGEPNPTHSFDTGSAWMSLALQASMNGLITHGMAGFDYERARKVINLPDDYHIEAMIAIGKHASLDVIPERMQKGEVYSDRKLLKELVFESEFAKQTSKS